MAPKLNTLMTGLPEGTPVTTATLRSLGVTPQHAHSYVAHGWLRPLARGVFERVGDELQLHPSLRYLECRLPGLHVGGKTALDWYGVRHYAMQRPVLRLYGPKPFRVPEWFQKRFPSRYHAKRLFDETDTAPLEVGPFESRGGAPLVSEPERGYLEMLSEVGVRQPLTEARELTESTRTFRADRLEKLLRVCRSVKTVRLALTLGREAGLPWRKALEGAQLPTGSKNRWVMRSKDGLLVLDP